MKKIKSCVIAFTNNGVKLAEKLDIGDVFVYYKYADGNEYIIFRNIGDIMERCWKNYEAIVFISACGIAVRSIAPFVSNKATDPAVIVCDELGKFAISLLSGHIGGANEISKKIAKLTGGIPIITTATDILDRFSVDVWAKAHKLVLRDMKMAKKISAAVVNGDEVGYKGSLTRPVGLSNNTDTELGVYVGYTLEKPFKKTLTLAEKCLVLGIGCRANTPYEKIHDAVTVLFKRENLNTDSIKMIASISIKANELGIIKLADEFGVNFATYSAYYLERIQGEFSYSEFVKKETGLDCVCERAALSKGGKLIVKKQVFDGVTLAVAKL